MRFSKAILTAATVAGCMAGPAGRETGWGQAPDAQGGTAGQSAAASGTATLQVFSRETVVDVTVTDLKGAAIHDLKPSDFTIEEDGKPQPIHFFHEYGERDLPENQAPPKLPPNVYTNVQAPPTTSAVNILLLDSLNTQVTDQVYVKQEALKYLKSMPKGTRVAVLGLSSRLRILQGFTADPSVLIAVVDSKKARSLPSPFSDDDVGDTISALGDIVDDGAAATLAEFENEQSTFQADMKNRMTLEALNQIAAYVSGIKGRKNLIWFTSGIPLNIFPTGGVNDLQGMTDYAKDLRKTTDLLTAAEVAVYPVDARGLFNNPANSAATATTGLTAKNGAQHGAQVAAANLKFSEKTGQEQLSMVAVAEATGGEAYFNTNDLKSAVGKAIENGANYYTVSYVPPSQAFDGRYHSISVKVDRPDVKLSYRKGYNADDIAHNALTPDLSLATAAPEPYGTNMQASMGRGVPTSSQLLFSVRVAPSEEAPKPGDPPIMGALDPKLQSKKLVRYNVTYVLPARQLMFTAAAGSRSSSVQFDVAAYDVYGKLITQLSQTQKIKISDEQYQKLAGTPVRFFQQVDIPPGEIFLRVGVLDEISDKVGTTEIPITVKKMAAPPAAPVGGQGGS